MVITVKHHLYVVSSKSQFTHDYYDKVFCLNDAENTRLRLYVIFPLSKICKISVSVILPLLLRGKI